MISKQVYKVLNKENYKYDLQSLFLTHQKKFSKHVICGAISKFYNKFMALNVIKSTPYNNPH